jgi:hypothetical protein
LRCIDLVDTIPFVLLWKDDDDDDDDEVLGESVEEKIVEEGVDDARHIIIIIILTVTVIINYYLFLAVGSFLLMRLILTLQLLCRLTSLTDSKTPQNRRKAYMSETFLGSRFLHWSRCQ